MLARHHLGRGALQVINVGELVAAFRSPWVSGHSVRAQTNIQRDSHLTLVLPSRTVLRVQRITINLMLILALVFTQGLRLHGHLDEIAPSPHGAPHDHGHDRVHSHWLDAGDVDEDHLQAVEVDLVGANVARDVFGDDNLLALVAVWALVLLTLWTCIRRVEPKPPPIHFGPPRFLRPSLRAPPL